ncbi:hypothetical protein P9112_000329 [Eukaryota sp. TZLM1-RC]
MPQTKKVSKLSTPAIKSKLSQSMTPKVKRPRRTWEEELNKWEGWRDIYYVGTEWENYDRIFEIDWDFSNLEQALTEGSLKDVPRVYIFGQTEPQMVDDDMVMIPTLIAVECAYPPTQYVVFSSIQSVDEELAHMRKLKVDWVPYMETDYETHNKAMRKNRIQILKCTQRRAALSRVPVDKKTKYTYALPFIQIPGRTKAEEEVTSVFVEVSHDDQGFDVAFDWKHDDINEIIEETIEDNFSDETDQAVIGELKDKIRSAIQTTVAEAKEKQESAKKKKNDIWDAKSEAEKEALKGAKFHKFYPVGPENLDISSFKTPFIGRYCPDADVVNPPIKEQESQF